MGAPLTESQEQQAWHESLPAVKHADAVWDHLADAGYVDARGGSEYGRRINGLREWLATENPL